MRSETEIMYDGMNVLIDKLGVLEAEYFVTNIHRDTFDYTEWQKKLWNGKSVREICDDAIEFRKSIGKK